MKIRSKITLLVGVLVAISFSLLLTQYFAERERTEALLEGIRDTEQTFFSSVLSLSGSSVAVFASDYTFWDEMVSFVEDPDPLFAEENLETGVDTFSADEAFVYDRDANLVYAFEREEETANPPQLPQEAFDHFSEERLSHFFHYQDGLLTEFYTATIHPTDDPDRVTDPQGFFLVGKRWNAEYLELLKERTGAQIEPAGTASEASSEAVTVSFPYEVRSWDGPVVETFTVTMPVPVAAAAAEASSRQLLLITGSFVLLLVLVYIFLDILVGRPIEALSRGIVRKDHRTLQKMRESQSEFGTLAQLVLNFSEHELVIEAKAKDDAILSAVGSGLAAVDVNGKLTLLNTAAEKLLGVPAGSALGQLAKDVFHMETRDGKQLSEADLPLARALHERKIITTVMMCVRADGTKFPTVLTAAPVMRDNAIIGAVQDFRDITQEEAVERAKTDFMSLVSHELRTPLTLLRWSVEKLALRKDLPADISGSLVKSMTAAMARMQSLIGTILDVSKIETESLVPAALPVSVQALIEKGIEGLKSAFEDKHLEIVTEYGTGIKDISSDERLLGIVISSILTNAVRYSDEGGQIRVKLSIDGPDVVVAIANGGPGIPLEEQPKIFTKLFRATNARLLNPDGTGLGLYISKSFLERLGGSISFDSEPGKETVFIIRVPREPKLEVKD